MFTCDAARSACGRSRLPHAASEASAAQASAMRTGRRVADWIKLIVAKFLTRKGPLMCRRTGICLCSITSTARGTRQQCLNAHQDARISVTVRALPAMNTKQPARIGPCDRRLWRLCNRLVTLGQTNHCEHCFSGGKRFIDLRNEKRLGNESSRGQVGFSRVWL